ncbi:hypothetical protein BCL69_101912 [Nitrosomonas communis]|uniref:Uncharacterized protein n=1 Tax=Nitrosomonas communis TaxID=44574 RepID=A0A1H2URQ5_9PROT|nr:hypothetical protein BCL69_101912 [Nitrosomonas communis]SDW58813.1 hypothetical protein SAMN05421882_101751 [Nitrosomonas communis]
MTGLKTINVSNFSFITPPSLNKKIFSLETIYPKK